MPEMDGQYLITKSRKDNLKYLILFLFLIILGIDNFMEMYGVYDYISYSQKLEAYHILEGRITNVYVKGVGKGRMCRTNVYCQSTARQYELSSRHEDEIGKNVVIAVGYSGNVIWTKPYIPKEKFNIGIIPLVLGLFGWCSQCAAMRRKKIVYAKVLYKKTYKWELKVFEYAVCTCYDENGKEFLLETRSGKFPIEVQVKDELAVLVEPGNYKNHEFIMEDGKWIKREELPLGL